MLEGSEQDGRWVHRGWPWAGLLEEKPGIPREEAGSVLLSRQPLREQSHLPGAVVLNRAKTRRVRERETPGSNSRGVVRTGPVTSQCRGRPCS